MSHWEQIVGAAKRVKWKVRDVMLTADTQDDLEWTLSARKASVTREMRADGEHVFIHIRPHTARTESFSASVAEDDDGTVTMMAPAPVLQLLTVLQQHATEPQPEHSDHCCPVHCNEHGCTEGPYASHVPDTPESIIIDYEWAQCPACEGQGCPTCVGTGTVQCAVLAPQAADIPGETGDAAHHPPPRQEGTP